MKRYCINKGAIEPDANGQYILFTEIEGYLQDLVRQPHAVNAEKAERHHIAIAELLELFGLPPQDAPIPRDHVRLKQPIVETDSDGPDEPLKLSGEMKVIKRRGRPKKV